MLVRALNIDKRSPDKTTFKDVSKDYWGYSEIEAAYSAGLVDGMRNGRFAPDEKITREQMGVTIIRAIKATGINVTITEDERATLLGKYNDGKKYLIGREIAWQYA